MKVIVVIMAVIAVLCVVWMCEEIRRINNTITLTEDMKRKLYDVRCACEDMNTHMEALVRLMMDEREALIVILDEERKEKGITEPNEDREEALNESRKRFTIDLRDYVYKGILDREEWTRI